MSEESRPEQGDAPVGTSPQSESGVNASGQAAPQSSGVGSQRIWNPYSQKPGAAADAQPVQPTQSWAPGGSPAPNQASWQASSGAPGQAPYQGHGYTQPGYQQPSQPYAYNAAPGASAGAQGQGASIPPQGSVPAGGKPKKPKGPKKPLPPRAKTFLAGFGGALLACVISLGAYTAINGGSASTVTLGGSGSTITVNGDDATLAEVVAQKASPSVVSIETYVSKTQSMGLGSASSSKLEQYSSGSGVIISADGYIVTNYHVIEGTSKVMVSAGGKEYEAKVVGSDQSSDLAVLKIGADNLTAIEVGSSEDLKVGEWCMAVGSAFGLGQSVSTGIVSATNCTYDELNDETGSAIYANLVQTDAAVNPGNSGGALVDKDGKFIGVTTLGATYSGDNSGVNFAIPVDYVMNIAQQIIDGKTPTHAQMGVTMTTINSQTADYYGLPVSEGAYVTSVSSKSGADKAGMKQGDIVTAINGEKVSSALDVILAIRSHKTGDTLQVTINRSGTEQTLDVTLGSDS